MDISSLLNNESVSAVPAGPLATPPLDQQSKPLFFSSSTPLSEHCPTNANFVSGFPSPSPSPDNELTHIRPRHQHQHPYHRNYPRDMVSHGHCHQHREEVATNEPMPLLTGPALKAERRVQALIHYHHHLRFPIDATKNERDMWRLWIGRSALSRDGRSLFEKGTDGQWRRYLRPRERAPVMRRIHEEGKGGHRKAGDLLRALRTGGYTWKGMTADVRRFVADCTVCAVRCARGQRSTYHHRSAESMNDATSHLESHNTETMIGSGGNNHNSNSDNNNNNNNNNNSNNFAFPYSPSCSPEPASARLHHPF